MRVLYVGYTLWKSIVQDNSYAIYEESIGSTQVRAWAGGAEFVYRTDVSDANYTDYTTAFPSGRTSVGGEDEALARILNFQAIIARPTYYATAQMVGPSGGGPGGTDKSMLTLLNPASSGKILKLLALEFYPLSSSGTGVLLDVQLRRITAHTAGTTVTPIKRDTADAASIAQVRSEPTGVTGGAVADKISQHALQANTSQSASAHLWKFGMGPSEKPFVLAEGEGMVVHQVTSNGGTNAVGLLWIEE